MKNRTKQKAWVSLILAVMLVVLAGCQSISGFDLNKVIQNGVSVKSAQGTQTFALELIPNASVKPSDDEQKMFDLFSNVKVKITDMKQQDPTHVSAKGVFEYNKGQIPFQVAIIDQDYIFSIEGAKKPIVFHNSMVASKEMKKVLSQEMQEQINQLYKKAAEWTPSFVSYLVGNAPNPKTISVSDSKEYINNEGLNGKKIHIEIKGSDLLELTKGFLTNVLADEKGLKDMLGQIYDLYVPMMQQAIKEGGDAQSNPLNETISPYLSNKTLTVEFAFTFIKSTLTKALDNYDQSVQEMMSSPQGEKTKVLLSDSQYMKMDLFVDNELLPRKSTTEIMISAPDNTSALKAVKITSSRELWNMNKPVTADKIDASAGQLELSMLSKPAKVISVVDPKSQLYGLLKHDLNITKKEITMIMDDNSGYDHSAKPYNRNGTIMVPVRFVVEQLDADVEWEQATQKVTVTDPLSGAVIHLYIGSKQASVNGMIKPLETEAELTNGSTFVPIRFIAENMGAQVSWEQASQMVTIIRD